MYEITNIYISSKMPNYRLTHTNQPHPLLHPHRYEKKKNRPTARLSPLVWSALVAIAGTMLVMIMYGPISGSAGVV